MSRTWSLDASSGRLRILTGVAGPAAKAGHRLIIEMHAWQATVQWRDGEPTSAELTVVVDSLEVLRGDGGLAPLSSQEKGTVRSNALKTLDANKYPQIQFDADDITKGSDGYRLTGTVEIHGRSRPLVVDLAVADADAVWTLSAQVPIKQSDFGIKPYSLLMGALKVADAVTIDFTATHPR